jgi:hypothetical protein
MAKRQVKKTNKIEKQVGKTLFDHIKAVTQYQDPDYFDKLSDLDKKTWSNFMIQRFLSMNSDWTEFISEVDSIILGNQLKPELAYQIYISMIPKSNVFLKYIKSSVENKFPKELIDIFCLYYEISREESTEYLSILSEIDPQNIEITHMLEMYAFDEKEIKKILSRK